MRYALRAAMTLSVILLVFLAFNLVWAVKLPDLRWDVSQEKINTLSPAVLKLLAPLESPLALYYFNSKKPTFNSHSLKDYGKDVEEKLKAFEQTANGRITLHTINPAAFSEESYKAGLYGLDDKPGFFGLIGTRDGQVAQRIASFSHDREPLLEYEISHLITRLLQPAPAEIGLLSGLPTQATMEPLLQELRRHFDLTALEPNILDVPAHIKTLMLIHPRRLPERALYAIDQFVLGGGKLMMFIDPEDAADTQATPTVSALDGLLAGWGVQMPSGKVLVDSAYGSPQHRPTRLTLGRQAMNTNDLSTWKLGSVTVSNSGALFPLEKSRNTFTPLLRSSAYATLADPGTPPPATSKRGERYVIAARIEGAAYSAFPDGVDGQQPPLQKAEQIHVVVVADTDLLSERPGSSTHHSNSLFVLNTLDNLAAPDALANIRPRAATNYSLHVLRNMREVAATTYQDQAGDLERQLAQTEKEWQRLNPTHTVLGSEGVDTSTQLQVLNKERLRLPIELHALRVEAYAPVHRLELAVTLLMIVPLPALLCVIAWALFRWRHRCRPVPPAAFY
ncbi:Gldg family protein [Pseudomonas sp. S1_E04]